MPRLCSPGAIQLSAFAWKFLIVLSSEAVQYANSTPENSTFWLSWTFSGQFHAPITQDDIISTFWSFMFQSCPQCISQVWKIDMWTFSVINIWTQGNIIFTQKGFKTSVTDLLASRFNNELNKFCIQVQGSPSHGSECTGDSMESVQTGLSISSSESPSSFPQGRGHYGDTYRTEMAEVDVVLGPHQASGRLSVGSSRLPGSLVPRINLSSCFMFADINDMAVWVQVLKG